LYRRIVGCWHGDAKMPVGASTRGRVDGSSGGIYLGCEGSDDARSRNAHDGCER
jgi:hypothetical protein